MTMNSVHLAPNLTLIHGDCLEYMATLADGAYSLAVVDPPYGIGAENGTGDYSKAVAIKGKTWDTPPSPEYFARLAKVSERQIIWGGNYFHLPIRRGWICWYKTDEIKGRDFSEFELAWNSENVPARHVAMIPFQRNGSRIHPTQKPVALYRWLLQNYAKPGDTILDTHLGSGSSAIAAWEMGYTFTGIEIDKDYFDAAVERIKKRMSQPYLPGIVQPKAEQASMF